MRSERFKSLATWAMIVFIGVCYAMLGCDVELMGDDLSYMMAGRDYHGGNPLWWPVWVVRHWVYNNGRLANYIAPLLLWHSPRWLLISVNALAVAAFFALALRIMGIATRRVTASLVMISLLAYTMPWWDTQLMFDISFNYVWMLDVAMAFLVVFMGNRAKRLFWPCLLALLAGMTHEGLSLPLLCGFAAWLLPGRRYKELSRMQKAMLLCFAIGVVEVVFSPGTIMRGVSAKTPDAPVGVILAMSCFWVGVLLLYIGGFLIFRRRRLAALLREPWVVYFVAAVVSAAIVACGGIIGRSGWFAQTFALTALALPMAKTSFRLPRAVAAMLSAAMVVLLLAHYIMYVREQHRLCRETREIVEMWLASPNGIVRHALSLRQDAPWYLLMKTYPFPSHKNVYALGRLSEAWRGGEAPVVVIPLDAHVCKEPRENVDSLSVSFVDAEGRTNWFNVAAVTDPAEW